MRGKIAIRWAAFFAFLAFISFAQINSAWADAHHFNNGWLIIGIVTAIVAGYFGWITAKNSN